MRAIIAGLAGTIFATNAMAADYLRGSTYEGPTASYNWAGIYVGGQVGVANSTIDVSGAPRRLVAFIARESFLEEAGEDGRRVSEWLSIPKQGASSMGYGGFVGYNSQWGDVVVSTELNYTRVSLSAEASNTISRSFVEDNFRYDTTVEGTASAKITDYATIRVRAGYAMGWFLPYLTGGIAFGRADYSATASVGYPTPTDMLPPPTPPDLPRPVPPAYLPPAETEAKNGVIGIGYAFGAGVDIGLFPGMFIRGEYEHVELGSMGGVTASINSFRVAAALKF